MKQKSKIPTMDLLLLFVFTMTFELSTAVISVPTNDVLKWLICIVVLLYGIVFSVVKNDGRLQLLPREFLLLIFPLLIQSFWNPVQTPIALMRSSSFIIYCLAISSFFTRSYMNANLIERLLNYFFKMSVAIIFVINIIFINRYSPEGDFIGAYTNRNMTVSIVLYAFVVLLFTYPQLKHQLIKKILCLSLMIVFGYMIIITNSRTGIVCFFVAVFMRFILTENKQSKLRPIFVIILAGAVVYFLPKIGQSLNIVSINRLFASKSDNGSTGFSRGEVWLNAIELFKVKPILGWGNNSVYYNVYISHFDEWGVHNSFMIMLIEGGIVGFTFYLSFFQRFFSKIYKIYMKCRADKSIMFYTIRISVAVISVLMINAISESFLFSAGNVMSLPFWMVIIGDYYLLKKYKSEEDL